MSSLTKKQEWYFDIYLSSKHWQMIKKSVLEKYRYICSIEDCYKTRNLVFHHLSYANRGTLKEAEDIVILCHTHHFLCHFSLFGKVPLTSKSLMKRYKSLQKQRWRRIRPSHIIEWFIAVYAL